MSRQEKVESYQRYNLASIALKKGQLKEKIVSFENILAKAKTDIDERTALAFELENIQPLAREIEKLYSEINMRYWAQGILIDVDEKTKTLTETEEK